MLLKHFKILLLENRIIGGTAAVAGQFPYIAAIFKTTNDGQYFCTGSLFNRQWVLTAGQCVYQY